MPVATLTEFPRSFTAGDTIRVRFSDSRFPSSLWTAQVVLMSSLATIPFDADALLDDTFELEIDDTDSDTIPPGRYSVAFIYEEDATEDRHTIQCCTSTLVRANPAAAYAKTPARLLLEAMEAAYLRLMSNPRSTVNFNGQSFTNRNPDDFLKAIAHQRAVVAAEDAQRFCGSGSGLQRIVHRVP